MTGSPLTVVNVSGVSSAPNEDLLQRWVQAATAATADAAVDIRIVDRAESAALNARYRGQAQATNVLAFPAEFPPEADFNLLGDLVICAQLVEQEAREQGKTAEAHWAHLVVHGCLHLQGYDHLQERDAQRMEALESEILVKLGYAPPYAQAS